MNKNDSQMINARRACLVLAPFAVGQSAAVILTADHREYIADLLEQFGRLDAGERKRNVAARANGAHGAKGGRPRTDQPAPRPDAVVLPALATYPRRKHFEVANKSGQHAVVFASTSAQVRRWAAANWYQSQQGLTVMSRPDLNEKKPGG